MNSKSDLEASISIDFVAQCDNCTITTFTDADGEFLDVCDREEITCDRNHNVTKMSWLRTLGPSG